MSTVRERLSQLGRPLKPHEITVQDETVEIFYQRPTLVKDRILRESMQEEYNRAVKTMTTPPENGDSVRVSYEKAFREAGPDKTVDFIVSTDLEQFRIEAIKATGKEQPPADADEAVKNLWLEEFKPAFDAIVESAKEEHKKEDFETLIVKATDLSLDRLAKEQAFGVYRLRLIMDSIYDVIDGKATPVFTSTEDVEEELSADTIAELARLISVEITKAREVPLISVAKTS